MPTKNLKGKSADETGYNGWANYPTWAVNLWLNNEEPLYRELRERASLAHVDASQDPNVEAGIWTVLQATRYRLAENIQEWVTGELAPDLGPFFPADLLGWALGQVDWDEIAAAALEDVR